jgi:hypothetical protein
MFSVAAQTSKTTVQFSETCGLCLCNETVFLPFYNFEENLHEKKNHSISSTIKVSCSGKVQLYLTL